MVGVGGLTVASTLGSVAGGVFSIAGGFFGVFVPVLAFTIGCAGCVTGTGAASAAEPVAGAVISTGSGFGFGSGLGSSLGSAGCSCFIARSENLDCGATTAQQNVYGWGVARSTTLTSWEQWSGNPVAQSNDLESCGMDMPQPLLLSSGELFVYHPSDDVLTVHRERLTVGSACTPAQASAGWREKDFICMPSCGGRGWDRVLPDQELHDRHRRRRSARLPRHLVRLCLLLSVNGAAR